MARPHKLTKELTDELVGLLRGGAELGSALKTVRISEATWYAWRARGKAEQERMEVAGIARPKASEAIFLEFLELTDQSQGRLEALVANKWVKAALDGDWRAAQAFLERRNPKQWGRVNRTEISGPDGGPVKQETTVSRSDSDLRAIADQIMGLGEVALENLANQDNQADK